MSDTDHMDPLALDIHDLAEADAQCGHSLSTWRAARMAGLTQVPAVVVRGLGVNLLGQSVLGKLGKVELQGDEMVIRH